MGIRSAKVTDYKEATYLIVRLKHINDAEKLKEMLTILEATKDIVVGR
ncbi:hypothetical protein [Sphingobacterium sp. CZ-UAM]|nr:hypothetical protein [Sphingobacterium sp. CZ-UAM]